jgi:hypothetical protein
VTLAIELNVSGSCFSTPRRKPCTSQPSSEKPSAIRMRMRRLSSASLVKSSSSGSRATASFFWRRSVSAAV